MAWVTHTWVDGKGSLYLVDLTTGEVVRKHVQPRGNPFTCVDINSAATQVVTASLDKTVQIRDITSFDVIHELHAHSGVPQNAYFLAGGRRIVTMANNELIRIWDLARGSTIAGFHSAEGVTGQFMAISPDVVS